MMRPLIDLVENANPTRRVIDDFRAWAQANTPNCFIDFMPGDTSDELEVDSLWVQPEARGTGEGSRAMRMLCSLADRYGVTLSLAPTPTDDENPALDSNDLRDFYKRCGFEWNHSGVGMPMIRTPQQINEAYDDDLPYDRSDPVVKKYVEGFCYAMAIAHHRRYGWPIYCLGADDDDYAQYGHDTDFFHGMVLHPTGVVLDITGPHSPEEFIEKWGEPFFRMGDEKTLLSHLNDFMRQQSLGDVAEAERTIDTYLKPRFPELYETKLTEDAQAMTKPVANSKGLPIAFTPEDQTNFWRWFQGSRIVDRQGRPLVVYHGTDASFSSFDSEMSNANTNTGVPKGAFAFSDDPGVSSSYTVNEYNVNGWRDPNITAAFRHLVKTASFDAQMEFLENNPAGYDNFKDGGNVMPVYLRIRKPLIVDAKNSHWNEIYFQPKGYRQPEDFTTNEIAQYAMENGYDGCVIKNVKDMHKRGPTHIATTYYVFSPTQIKSALSNVGTYRDDHHDIGESIETVLEEGFWGQVDDEELYSLHTPNDLKKIMRIAQRQAKIDGPRNWDVDCRGFWFPDSDRVIGFSGWNLTHQDVWKVYPEAYNGVPLTFDPAKPKWVGLGDSGDKDQIQKSPTMKRIMGGDFEIEEGVY